MSLSSSIGEGAAYWPPSRLNWECEKLQKKKKTDDTAEAAEKREEKKRKAVEKKATKKAEASKTAKKPRAK